VHSFVSGKLSYWALESNPVHGGHSILGLHWDTEKYNTTTHQVMPKDSSIT